MLEKCRISGFADEIHKDFTIQLSVLKELGQSYLELRGADGEGVADFTEETVKMLKEKMVRQNIQVSAIGSPIGKIGITEDFEPHFQKFCNLTEMAKALGTPNIRLFSFYMPDGCEPGKWKDQVFARTERMVDYARQQGVVLLHENEKGIYGDNGKRCLELMEEFYCDSFQAVFDFANFVQCGQNTLEAYEMLKPYIGYVHVKDALDSDGTVVLPGEGDGNVKYILQQLDQRGYEGFLSLEPHLTSFAGLEKLEKEERERKERNGMEAYKLAYRKMIHILGEQ